ncbi:extracellular solute-binding protein [Streptomyces sp. MS19]|uniref:sugar ABC transporter substrate-binding protein n=1 Tax=Streptomyces sp. MS19 TaxID=3385972 RepID=UPI00399F7806
MRRHLTFRSAGATAIAIGVLAGVTACSDSGSGGGSDSASGTFTFWDPYPQWDEDSAWGQQVRHCAEETGVTIDRTGYDTSDLTTQALLAGQQGNSPDIIVLDNPVVSTLAEAGLLTSTDDLGLDTSAFAENLLAPGRTDGASYGVPIGANTTALYYNADVLADAGVDPASVTDWASLTDALEQVTAAGHKGITFAGIGTEEGSFQFLPWLWGAGADLHDIASPEAVSALELWKGWLDAGYAPNSVISNSQQVSWQEFETGEYAFAQNGTWQLAAAEASGIDYGVLTIPSAAGGPAPGATGGEFVTAPVQGDDGRYETTAAIIDCLVNPDNLLETDTALSYIAPIEDLRARQVEDNPALAPWVEAVGAARGRTTDLGTDYPVISEQLWTAVQNALSGSQSPRDALEAAQQAAASGTGD